jgi:hypothetical protein
MGLTSGNRPPQFQKVSVVSFLKEYIFTIVATVINMIKGSICDGMDIAGHNESVDLAGL